MYETPFTQSGAARGAVESQWKRRTILTSKSSSEFCHFLQIVFPLQLNTVSHMC